MIITLDVKPHAADAIARAVQLVQWSDHPDDRIARQYLQAIVGQAVILRGHRSPEALAAIRDYWAPKSQRNSAHAPKSHAAHPHN